MDRYPLRSSDEEKRRLRCRVACLEKGNEAQKEARKKLERKIKEVERRNKELERRNKQLEQEKEDIRRQCDRYKRMLFKPNIKPKKEEEEVLEDDLSRARGKKTKRGAKKGHPGRWRRMPHRIDVKKRVYLKRCPICNNRVKRSEKVNRHIVEDIPSLDKFKTEVTDYETEEQWCSCCRKWVRAQPVGVIPKSRIGLNLVIYAMIQKYAAKSSWESIVFNLKTYFNIHVSKGTLVDMMHRARRWLGPWYDRILEEIRESNVKYADETQWRICGINNWLWGFFTEKGAYYTVEESRGKQVAKNHLKGSKKNDVLVRDDYPGYKNLKFNHQSCWAHLLRKSKEAANEPKATREVKILHKKLKNMHRALSDTLKMPFNTKGRETYYDLYDIKIKEIIDTKYKHKDTKSIQTRIANQNTNLITALKYKDVPLTNNLAERGIRPFVIARKMSGGSRSVWGAKTQAVNMSILQTVKMKELPLIPTLKNYLVRGLN